MGLPHIPSPEKTLDDLSWLHPEIFRAFEHGVYKGRRTLTVRTWNGMPLPFPRSSGYMPSRT